MEAAQAGRGRGSSRKSDRIVEPPGPAPSCTQTKPGLLSGSPGSSALCTLLGAFDGAAVPAAWPSALLFFFVVRCLLGDMA